MTVAGTVTVDDAGARTGSGLALDLYDSILTIQTAAHPLPDPTHKDADFDGTAVEWSATMLAFVVKMKRAWAREAQEHANVIAPLFFTDTTIGQYLLADSAGNATVSGVDSNLVFPVKAGEKWHVLGRGAVTCSGAGGVKLGLSAPAGSTIVGGETYGDGIDSITWESALLVTPGAPVGAYSAQAGGDRMAYISAVVAVAIDGFIAIQYASVTVGQTSKLVAGYRLDARKVTGV